MTILAETENNLVEYEHGVLTITDLATGHALAATGKRIAGDFRDCLKTHSPERVTATYIRLLRGRGIEWEPLYNPDKLARRRV